MPCGAPGTRPRGAHVIYMCRHSDSAVLLSKDVVAFVFSDTEGTANEYKKANGVCLLGYNSRYVTHQMTAYITAVAKSDDLTSNSSLSVC